MLKVTEYVLPAPVMMALLVKLGASIDCTLCDVAVAFHVQVTVVPATT